MKTLTALLCALVFAGCVTTGTLDHWNGRDEKWLIWKEGPADVDDTLGVLTPGEPTSSPLLDAIHVQVPTYRGPVRHLQWTALAYDYHAYLILTNATWQVVDAFRTSHNQ